MMTNVKEIAFVKRGNSRLFGNILVPYDLSSQSTKAFKVALDIAKKYDSKITLLTCLEGDAWRHRYYDARADNQLIKQQKKAAKVHTEKLEALAKRNNVSVKSRFVPSKSVVNDIVSFSKLKKHDLVVLGSHGRSGFDRWLLGSVANGVSQKINCPVLIVK